MGSTKASRTSLQKSVDFIDIQLRHGCYVLKARYHFGDGELSRKRVTGVVFPVKQKGNIVLGVFVGAEDVLEGGVAGITTQFLMNDAGFVRPEAQEAIVSLCMDIGGKCAGIGYKDLKQIVRPEWPGRRK